MDHAPQRWVSTGLGAAAVAASFAVWLYWPVWSGGLLADELVLMGYLTVPGDAGMQVDWQRVLDDFHGPWAFGYGNYYRPLVTLTMALGYWLAAGGAWVFHTISIGLFALCVFSVARWCGELFGARAAWFGGLLLAAHPALHEPICWPCTSADFLVLIAIAWTCICFVRYLRGGRRGDLAVAMLAAVFALLSKETGVLLAIWLPLLDLTVRGRPVPLASRLRLHLMFAPLWLLYLGWRWWILGTPISDTGPASFDEPLSRWSMSQLAKLQACVLPMGSRMPAATPFVMATLTSWVLVGALCARQNRRWLWVALVWMGVSFLPVQWEQVLPNLGKSRYVIPAVLGFLLVGAAVVGRPPGARWFRLVGALLLAAAVACLATGTRRIQVDYQRAWEQMHSLRHQIDVAAENATVAAPLVMLGGLRLDDEIAFLPAEMAFAAAQRPLVAVDRPFVSLGHVVQPGVGEELSGGDVTSWRAWWQHGGQLFHWSAEGDRVDLTMVPTPARAPAVVLDREATRFVVRGGSAPPWPIGAIEVVADAAFAGGDLIWRNAAGHGGVVVVPTPVRVGDSWSATVDLNANGDFVVFGALAGITAFEVTLSPLEVTVQSLRVLPPPPSAPVPQPLRGERLALHDLPARLPWSVLPPDTEPGSIVLVLMNRALAMRIPLSPGQPLLLPRRVGSVLAQFDRQVHDPGVHYCYLEARAGGRRWQSALDWFVRLR